MEISTDPEMGPRRTDYPTARVRIALRGRHGRSRRRRRSCAATRSSPVPADEIIAKFVSLAAPILGESTARKIVEVVEDAEKLEDVGSLTAMLVP